MPRRRRIVPDNSVMVPAFFPEKVEYRGSGLDLTRRARPLADAIRMHAVDAYAPDQLVYEFTKTAHRKTQEGVSIDKALQQLEWFRSLPIRRVPTEELTTKAWQLMTERQISPPDSWYLACAVLHKAELWILSRQDRDHFGDHARGVYEHVFFLTERRFDQP